MRQFPPIDLVTPQWRDPIVNDILALEELRYPNEGRAATHPVLFEQIRDVLQTLESVASARIEGNRTTLADYLDSQRGTVNSEEGFREIFNIEDAIRWIETDAERAVDASFIKELHRRIVDGLTREGDVNPGGYRNHAVRIAGSAHRPPATRVDVEREMRHLLDFATASFEPRDELLRIALFHHRFMAIHPFGNGNGRTGRLVTYAMLLRGGYRADIGQTINPAAVFCLSRQRYYEELSNADRFTEEGLLSWCRYLIGGIREEIAKVNQLADLDYVRAKLLYPAIEEARVMGRLTKPDETVLSFALRELRIRNRDLQRLLDLNGPEASRLLSDLRRRHLLQHDPRNSHLNFVRFSRSPLTYPLVRKMLEAGFAVPELT